EDCNKILFTVGFENCVLDLSSFYKLKMKNTSFKNSSMQEVDFTEADLTGALFENCNLLRTVFDNTVLHKADFRSAFNISIDPEKNRTKKAKFSVGGVAGLLHKYNIEIE
ncbi:MAG: pentapeptide repeat-containing protein, partial [Bacteroidota bacterium]